MPSIMHRYLIRVLLLLFLIAVAIRLLAMFGEPSPAKVWLSLTYSRLTRPIIGGLAPQINCNAPEDILEKGSYSVVLASGYTIARHKQTVGRADDIDAVTENILDHPFPGFQITYFARIADQTLLRAIRADPGVDFVECDIVEGVEPAVVMREGREGR